MNTFKLIRLPLVLLLLLGAAFFSTACKDKSVGDSVDDAIGEVQDAADNAADAVKDATN